MTDTKKADQQFMSVIVFLNNLQFDADKFETRTMPTPNMKGKEMIYWIKVNTEDRRLAKELERFLENAPQQIDLRVPSAFISAKAELESHRVIPPAIETSVKSPQRPTNPLEAVTPTKRSPEEGNPGLFKIEILLRRTLPQSAEKQTQSPYG